MTGDYSCYGIVTVYDGTTNLLNDSPPSCAFITPVILASAEVPGVEIRVTRRLRLAGRYWAGVSTGTAKMVVGTDFKNEFGTRTTMEIPKGTYTVELVFETATVVRTGVVVGANDVVSVNQTMKIGEAVHVEGTPPPIKVTSTAKETASTASSSSHCRTRARRSRARSARCQA